MKKIDENRKGMGKNIFRLAAALGLLTGLVEGIELLALHQAGLLTWRLQNRAIWFETLWIAPLVDVLLFSLVGGGFALINVVLPKIQAKKLIWFSFIFLALFDWIFIVLYGRISLIALLALASGLAVQLTYSAIRYESFLMHLARRSLPGLAGLAMTLFVIVQGGGWLNEMIRTARLPDARPGTPNVLIIIVDALRADHLSGYDYPRNTSPFIDSLAEEGARFEMAISPSSWTQPSHASLLTGRYTYDHQAELKPLDNRYPTIGEALQAQGYRTGAFSGNTFFFTRRQGFGRGFLYFEDNFQSVQDIGLNSLYGFIFEFYGLRKALKYEGAPTRKYAEDINRSALGWVDEDSSKPFFVFINYFDVHDPYLPPEPYRSRYANVVNPGGLVNGYVERYSPSLTPEQIQTEVDAYDGSINYVDDRIKDLFDELQQRGLLENTLVIITSDHGEAFGEHGLLQHSASLYMEEIHVPLIFWWPGHIPAGHSVETPVTISSLPATVLSLIGSQNEPLPGPSLEPLVVGRDISVNWPNPISELAHMVGALPKNPSTHGALKSVVGTEVQYIIHEKFGEEVYNWNVDSQETSNLIDDPAHRSVVEEFKTYLEELIGNPIFSNP